MKMLLPILLVSFCAGCATPHVPPKKSKATTHAQSPRASSPAAAVSSPEIDKAYPVGRYTDPNFPDTMHERHTLYRREQAAGWDYQSSQPYSLPLGPVTARSNPSPSYFLATDAEERDAQQKAYSSALEEQNRAMKKRIDGLMQDKSKSEELKREVERLKTELEAQPKSVPSPSIAPEKSDDFSQTDDPNFPDAPSNGPLPEERQAQLLSQMRANDASALTLGRVEKP